MRQIERLRCRHRIRVLQAHEDTAKDNAVSGRTRDSDIRSDSATADASVLFCLCLRS